MARTLTVETHFAGQLYPGDRRDVIAYMAEVTELISQARLSNRYLHRHCRLAIDTFQMLTRAKLKKREEMPMVTMRGRKQSKTTFL